ncbi:hypothetical protein NDU88_005242 [Pleurodeles waltl]|uniref:Uncharacterized protein n=1 Tax=Pleurodeles waltl TaxID=8319 RepID=A0AAV7WWI0_PLEWA|nr:hypothetical protein NDU88_005242 [Pleurodeles waltl]
MPLAWAPLLPPRPSAAPMLSRPSSRHSARARSRPLTGTRRRLASSSPDPGDLIGHLWQPRDQLRVKSGASERSKKEARGSGDIRVTKEEQEDEETTIEEEDGRKTEPTGAGVSQRRFGDSWPGEPAYTPPRFRRSVASPGTETETGKGGGK